MEKKTPDEWEDLKKRYNDAVGSDGDKFLYSTTPAEGGVTYYVFRDAKVSGRPDAMTYMLRVLTRLGK